ncbi:MAG: hypothetical protein ACI4KL_00065 [Lentihominibacter sp.]
MKQFISAEAFKRSITEALKEKQDFKPSLKLVRGFLSQTGPGALNISRQGKYFAFRKYEDGRQVPLVKSSAELYRLARKRYLTELLKLLELYDAVSSDGLNASSNSLSVNSSYESRRLGSLLNERNQALQRLMNLIDNYEKGNLDIGRIVMTPKQYSWYTKPFRHKTIPEAKNNITGGGVITRSKSEKELGNAFEYWAAFYHYEEKMTVYVYELVKALNHQLREYYRINRLNPPSRLYYYSHGTCIWNVPPEFQWMNAPGSVWKTYNERTGNITMYNDFRFMPVDSSTIILEHEGLLDDFLYRNNASERIALLKLTGTLPNENIIETSERETGDAKLIQAIIKRDILPRLWF